LRGERVPLIEVPYPGDVTARVCGVLGKRDGSQATPAVGAGGKRRSPLRRVAGSVARCVLAIPDPQRGWTRSAVREGTATLAKLPVQAILSSGPPWTAHRVGQRLARAASVPWVAEYRDLWTQSHYYPYGRVRRVLDASIERRVVGRARRLVTVSPPLADDLRRLFPKLNVDVVRNGFDPTSVGTAPLTRKLTITHTGQLYHGKRDPSILFEALRSLADEGELDLADISVRLYGPAEDWLRERVAAFGLETVVSTPGIVPRAEIVERQRETQVLLLLSWSHPQEAGVYTGKLFEYQAAQRPILAVGGTPGVVSGLLRETGAGEQVLSLDQVRAELKRMYAEYRDTGAVRYYGDRDQVMAYDQRSMCRQLADVLDDLS